MAYGVNLVTNPGFETGTASGWTADIGTLQVRNYNVHSGTYSLGYNTATYQASQTIDISAHATDIDNGYVNAVLSVWHAFQGASEGDTWRIRLQYLDSGYGILAENDTGVVSTPNIAYTQMVDSRTVPSGTRYLKFILYGSEGGISNADVYYDDVSAILTKTFFTTTLTETITHSDVLSSVLLITKILTESISHIDTLLKNITLKLSETINHTDTMLRNIFKTITESITHTDTVQSILSIVKILTESISHADTLLRNITLNFTEAITHTDTFQSVSTFFKTLTEAITHSDTFNGVLTFLKVLTENIRHIDRLFLNGLLSIWTKRIKPTLTSWTNRTKPTTNWTKRTKP